MKTPQEEAQYNKTFHHNLFTWHITIQGFVFVGLLAVADKTPKSVGWICLSFVGIAAIYSIVMICRFSDRIHTLEGYSTPPPQGWLDAHKHDSWFTPHGEGTWFFIVMSLFFGLINWGLLCAKGLL